MKPFQPKGSSSKGDNKKLQKNIKSLMKQRKSQFGTCSGSGQGKPKRGRPKKAPELPDPNLKTFCEGHASRRSWVDMKEKVPIEGSETKVEERPKAPLHPSRSHHQTTTIKIDMFCEENRKRRRGRKSSSILVNVEVDANKAVKMGKIEGKNKDEAKESEETAVVPTYAQELLGSDAVLPSTSMASASTGAAPQVVENEVLMETVDPFMRGLASASDKQGPVPELNVMPEFDKEKEKKAFFFYQDTMQSDTEEEIEVGIEAKSEHNQEFMEVQTAPCPSPLSSISTASLESNSSEFTSSTAAPTSPMTSAVSERQSTSPVPSDPAISTATATTSVSPISPAPLSPAIPVIDGPLTIDQLRQYLAAVPSPSLFIPPRGFFVTSSSIPREFMANENEILEDGEIEDEEVKQEHLPSAFVRYAPP